MKSKMFSMRLAENVRVDFDAEFKTANSQKASELTKSDFVADLLKSYKETKEKVVERHVLIGSYMILTSLDTAMCELCRVEVPFVKMDPEEDPNCCGEDPTYEVDPNHECEG